MERFFFTIFEKLVDGIMILIFTGGIVGATVALQRMAGEQKHFGLVSLVKINQQLFSSAK